MSEIHNNRSTPTLNALQPSEPILSFKEVSFAYEDGASGREDALSRVNLDIKAGEFVAILGANGSGKSTLARHMNALLLPDEGRVYIYGRDSLDQKNHKDIHRLCGMVFQNPDNQIVGTTVEEDIAFGLENLGIPPEEIQARVDATIQLLGLDSLRLMPPASLSGGQKQKLAIAGILAMNPSCLILDEATSMLDPKMRHELLSFIQTLRHRHELTLILVTHYMEEALTADRILLMQDGKIHYDLPPHEFFAKEDLEQFGLDVPPGIHLLRKLSRHLDVPLTLKPKELDPRHLAAAAYQMIKDQGYLSSSQWDKEHVLSALPVAETAEKAKALDEKLNASETDAKNPSVDAKRPSADDTRSKSDDARSSTSGPCLEWASADPVIHIEHLSHRYEGSRPEQAPAIFDLNIQIKPQKVLAIAGASGSGKSTLIMHLNGLLRAQSGRVTVLGIDASDPKYFKQLRRQIGLLFQYPEHQLFAETLLADISFGPIALGVEAEQALRQSRKMAELMGFTESDYERSPFSFSGGQMRRAALAGVLASDPDILVLDEPAAGLDPIAKRQLLTLVRSLTQMGKTILMVSHDVDDIANYADEVLLMHGGKKVIQASVKEVLRQTDLLEENALEAPVTRRFIQAFLQTLKEEGVLAQKVDLSELLMELGDLLSVEEVFSWMKRLISSFAVAPGAKVTRSLALELDSCEPDPQTLDSREPDSRAFESNETTDHLFKGGAF